MNDDAPTPGPSAAGGTSEAAEKRVSSAELFFDLVFVLAVTEVSTLLGHDHSWGGVLRALIVFVPVYWLWVGTAIQTNMRDASGVGLRLAIFAVALAAVFMALALPHAYGDLGLLYALAYWAGRVVLGLGFFRRPRPAAKVPVNPFTVSMTITAPLLVVGALFHDEVRVALWGLAAAIDLSTPTVLRARLRNMHFASAHLAERFGLFVLIALGESVVAIGASAQSSGSLGVATAAAVGAAFALSCGMWWVYFHFAADMIGYALATARVQVDITRLVLSYGHLLFIGAIIGLAVGMRGAVAHPARDLGWAFAGLLFGGAALYLATFGMTRWIMRRRISTTRLGAAAIVLLLMPAARYLPALSALVGLAGVMAALNVVEYRRAAGLPSERRPWDPPPAAQAASATPAGTQVAGGSSDR